MGTIKWIVIILFPVFVFGCSAKITSEKIELPRDDDNNTVNINPNGIVYHLPATKLVITATQELQSCSGDPSISTTKLVLTQEIVPDTQLDTTFVIDIDALSSGNKKIPQADFTLSNNMISSVTYHATDATKEIISEIVKIAALAKGIPLPDGAAKMVSAPSIACAQEAIDALNKTHRVRSEIQRLQTDINNAYSVLAEGYRPPSAARDKEIFEALNSSYTKLLKAAAEDGVSSEDQLKLLTEAGKVRALYNEMISGIAKGKNDWETTLKSKIEALNKNITSLYASIEQDIEFLTAEATMSVIPYPSGGGTTAVTAFDFSDSQKWFSDQNLKSVYDDWVTKLKINVKVMCDSRSKIPESGIATALWYRVPALCSVELKGNNGIPVQVESVPIAQYGFIAGLEVDNGAFEDNTFNIDFGATDGRLTIFKFKSDKAAAEEALSAAGNAYSTLKETDEEKLKEETDKINLEKDLETAKKDLAVEKEARLKAEESLEKARSEAAGE